MENSDEILAEFPDFAGEGPAMRLMRLAAVCPRCGTPPAVRFTEEVTGATADLRPGERLATYRCQNRHCRKVFALTAAAFQQAHP